MAKQILVPMKRDDRVEEIIPCMEKVAQPGMKVVFLLRYPTDGFVSFLPLFAKLEGGIPQRLAATRELTSIFTWEGNLERAERKVAPICEVLERKGVETAVDVYTGSLRKAVRSYTLTGDVHGILTRARIGLGVKRFLHRTLALIGLVKQPSFSSILSLHPHHQV